MAENGLVYSSGLTTGSMENGLNGDRFPYKGMFNFVILNKPAENGETEKNSVNKPLLEVDGAVLDKSRGNSKCDHSNRNKPLENSVKSTISRKTTGSDDPHSEFFLKDELSPGISNDLFWPEENFADAPPPPVAFVRGAKCPSSDSSVVPDVEETLLWSVIPLEETPLTSLIPKIDIDVLLSSFQKKLPNGFETLCKVLKSRPLGVKRAPLMRYLGGAVGTSESCDLSAILDSLVSASEGIVVIKAVPGVGSLYLLADLDRKTIDLRAVLVRLCGNLEKIVRDSGGLCHPRSALELLMQESGIHVDLLADWQLENPAALIKFLLKVAPSGRIHCSPCSDEAGADNQDYVYMSDAEATKIPSRRRGTEKRRQSTSKDDKLAEDFNFVKFGERLEEMSMYIFEGLVLQCDIFQINSIIDFYCLLNDYWNNMESFQSHLGRRYKGQGDWSDEYSLPPPPRVSSHYVVPGMIAVCCMENEWKRVEIVSLDAGKRMCKVRSVELGVSATVRTKDLRMLDKDLFKSMPATAIHSRLRLPEPFSSNAQKVLVPGSAASSQSTALLKELVFGKKVYVTFRNHVQINDTDGFIWEVDVAVGGRDGDYARTEDDACDIGEQILTKLSRDPLFKRIFTR